MVRENEIRDAVRGRVALARGGIAAPSATRPRARVQRHATLSRRPEAWRMHHIPHQAHAIPQRTYAVIVAQPTTTSPRSRHAAWPGRGAVERLAELELERRRPRRATRQGTAREW